MENLIADIDIKQQEEDELTNTFQKKGISSDKSLDHKMVTPTKENSNLPEGMDRATLNLIYKAVKDNADENGWANLSMVGQYISAVKPDFDSRNYGRAKLSGLIKTLNLLKPRLK